MRFVRLTRVRENGIGGIHINEVLVNADIIETVRDIEMEACIAGEMKVLRPVELTLVSGNTVNIRFNGDSMDFARSLNSCQSTWGLPANHVSNLTWEDESDLDSSDEITQLELSWE